MGHFVTFFWVILLSGLLSGCVDESNRIWGGSRDGGRLTSDAHPHTDIALSSDITILPADVRMTRDYGLVPVDSFTPDVGLQLDAVPQTMVDASAGDSGVFDMASSEMDAMVVDFGLPTRQLAGLPRIHDYSGADEARVNLLVRRAVEGLGLDVRSGPNERDRIFVGRTYMVWLDETGFYGKMNGLWPLNGDALSLDFLLLDGVRPVNLLIVGEEGNGRWPGGYKGADHIEFPNRVPEADDDPTCANDGRFCSQYGLSEAGAYTDSDIPAWRACNEGRPPFDAHFEPIEITSTHEGLRIMYEGPLTKQGDFGGSASGSGCHQNFLFPDGVRRLVHLRVGYELRVNDSTIDRLLQVRNSVGNPTFDGAFNFIGGFVLSKYPSPHRLKRLDRYVRVEDREVGVEWNGRRIVIEPNLWVALPTDMPNQDVVLGWANQSVSLSSFAGFVDGRALSLTNHGPNENGDNGFCLCVVHGGIEMGGGLRPHPVADGRTSEVSIRRLTLHEDIPAPNDVGWVYEAEGELSHAIGRSEDDGWSAATHLDESGHLVYGPYAADWTSGPKRAVYRMLVDVTSDQPEIIATVDIFDATAEEIIASRPVLRSEFDRAFSYQNVHLDFDMSGRLNHIMETRLYWHDISYVRLDRVTVLPL